MNGKTLKYFSTFSGIGGFEIGIERAHRARSRDVPRLPRGKSFRSKRHQPKPKNTERGQYHPACVGYSEIDKYAAQIYASHYPSHTNYGDITRINADALPDFDLYVGGFPCQAFSIAGKRGGFDDTRGTLFFDVARILKAKRPKHFILENVKGLLSHDDGRTFKAIITTLVELGYGVEWQVLNSKDFGVPQNRERVFIVGHLGGECRHQVFPLEGNHNPPKEHELSFTLKARADSGIDNKHKQTVIAADSRIRRLTPTECERLQGFPDEWTEGVSDTQRYKTLGNAVTTNVIEAVVSAVYN